MSFELRAKVSIVFILRTVIKFSIQYLSFIMYMIKFLKPFLIFVVLYHLFVTIIWYGLLWWAYPQLPALGRDAIWLLFFGIICLANFKTLISYLKTRKRPRITFIIILIFGVSVSLRKWKSIFDIFVGIKYGLLYLFIFLSATFIGYIRKSKSWIMHHESSIGKFIKFLKYLLTTTLLVWFLRQGLKFIQPDIFLHIGYGPLNDFKFGVKPPIYYLTGYQWTARRQGIFSWPNNYGYFLIAFLPAIIYFFKQKFASIKEFFSAKKQTILNISVIILRILAIIVTLSRTAFIWWIVGLALINIQRIKEHKKIARGILILCIAGLVGISILKWASTLGHITAKFGSIKYVIDQPSGYGLWTSWPAVLHNGTILPENYYLQLMLDIWTVGFLLRALLIIQITRLATKIQKSFEAITSDEKTIYLIWKWLNIWRVCLLVMGIFLHVFEDSMINYLFFISRGILTWYLSNNIKKRT